MCKFRSSSFGVEMGYGFEGWGSILFKVTIFIFFIESRQTLGPLSLLFDGFMGALSPEIKLSERETHQLSQCSSGIKNGGALYPFPHTSS
jgi:hypothetical protein